MAVAATVTAQPMTLILVCLVATGALPRARPSVHLPHVKLPPSSAAWRPELMARQASHHADHRMLQAAEAGSGASTTPDADLASVCVAQGFEQCLYYAFGYCQAGALPTGVCAQIYQMDMCALVGIIEPHAAALGAPFLTLENCESSIGLRARSVQLWSIAQVGVWAFAASSMAGLSSSSMFAFTSN